MHAPGTIKGDLTEYKAIQKLFMKAYPLTTNKWKIDILLEPQAC
jgi:hypothetical protein